MSILSDTYNEIKNQGHAFEIDYEFDYNGERYYVEDIDEEDLVYPYETYPVFVRRKLFDALNNPSEEYENEYCDLVSEYRVCMSERALFKLKIKSLEEEIERLKEECRVVTNNEENAKIFIEAIKELANKPDNLDNFKCYLSGHFDSWLKRFGNTPENISAEMKAFAEMSI